MVNKLFLISVLVSTLFGDIQVFNRTTGSEFELQTLKGSKTLYVSTKDIAKCLSSKLYGTFTM